MLMGRLAMTTAATGQAVEDLRVMASRFIGLENRFPRLVAQVIGLQDLFGGHAVSWLWMRKRVEAGKCEHRPVEQDDGGQPANAPEEIAAADRQGHVNLRVLQI